MTSTIQFLSQTLAAICLLGITCTYSHATAITVAQATQSNNENGSGGAIAAANGDGLGLGYPATHTGANVHGWLGLNDTSRATTDPDRYGWMHYDFGSIETIDAIRLWNYNWQTILQRGIRDIDIYTSNDPAAYGNNNHASWNLLTQIDDLPMGPGHTTGIAYGSEYTFAPRATQYVSLDVTESWGNIFNTALAEVQFIAVPEPESSLIFAIPMIGLLLRRRT